MQATEEYLTTGEVASLLGVDRRTVARWIKEGRIRAVLVNGLWRIPREELRKLVSGRGREARSKKVAVYVCVEGSWSDLFQQLEDLREVARKIAGSGEVLEVADIGSCDELPSKRRGLAELLELIARGDVDTIVIRDPHHISKACGEFVADLLEQMGVSVVVHGEKI